MFRNMNSLKFRIIYLFKKNILCLVMTLYQTYPVYIFVIFFGGEVYSTVSQFTLFFKAKIWAISSDTHQLQLIKLHHFKLERFKSIKFVPGN